MNSFRRFYLLSAIGIILTSFYPIYMGIRVASDYVRNGSIDVANYPKYIIPYAPISIALIAAIALIPLAIRLLKRFALAGISAAGISLFFASELWFENMVVMDGAGTTSIENWQMFSCVATPQVMKSVGNILAGEYSPAFKVHFYIISIVVILAVLNCVLGFAVMIKDNNPARKRPLIAQAVCAAVFVGLCIYACFTAFFRNGQLMVSPVSALLMCLFFIVFGITVGVYAGSIFYHKKTVLSILLPSFLSMATTVVMYVGELILLNGVLFQYGSGLLFEPLGVLPFAAVDLAVIVFSGIATGFILSKLSARGVTPGDSV